jgi:two-component system, OmpR family, sensor kinase
VLGLRGRLLAAFLALMIVAALASTAVLSRLLAARTRDGVDVYLERQTRDFATAITPLNNHAQAAEFASQFFEILGHDPRELVLLFRTREGRFVSNVPRLHLEQVPEIRRLLEVGSGATWAATASGRVRAVARTIEVAGAPGGVYLVARFTDALDRDRAEQIRLFLLILIGAIGVAGAAGYFIAGRALQPLRQISRTARLISREDLSRRIEYRGPRDEVGELAGTFNEMLGRLEAAFAEQQRFLTDVSHELRTPMQVIKGHLEVLNRLPNASREETRETLALVLDEVDRMARLVAQLLTLARSVGVVAIAPIAVRPFLVEILRKATTLAPRRFALDVSGEPTVAADRDALTQIVLNLTQNAVDNTTPADGITLGAEEQAGRARIWVTDTGRGIPPAALPHVFDRFYRVDNDNGGGAGLGLSIVDALVRAQGGTVTVQSREGEGSIFEVVLPAR